MTTKQTLYSQETLQDYYHKVHLDYIQNQGQSQLISELQEFFQSSQKYYLILDTSPLSQLPRFQENAKQFKVLNEKNITLNDINMLLNQANQNLIIDMKSEKIGAKVVFLVSFIMKNQSLFDKVIIYINKYNRFVEYLMQSFDFSTINNNLNYIDELAGYRDLQIIKYEMDFQKIQDEIIIMEKKITRKNKFSRCNIIIFSRDSHHSSKLKRQLSTNSNIVQRMHIHSEEIETPLSRDLAKSNIYIISKSEILQNQHEIIDNCYLVIDYGIQQHVYFANQLHAYQEQTLFISKNEICRRQTYLSSNYPGLQIRVYRKQNFLRSTTDDIMTLMQREGNLYQYLCNKYNIDSHFFPQNNYISNKLNDGIKLFFNDEQEVLNSNLFHLNYLQIEDIFLRSLVSINQSLINKDSFETEKNIVFSILQNHMWSKEGLLQIILNFRSQIQDDQKKSKQKIVCLKHFLNPQFSNVSNTPCEPTSSLIQKYIKAYPNSLFVFSGIKRVGYINIETGQTFQISMNCPLKIYSGYPSLIIVHYMIQVGDNMMIQDYSQVRKEDIPDNLNQKIYKYVEKTKIEFVKQYFDISTLLFDTIWVNQGQLINAFQDEYNCIVQADPILDSILFYNINSSEDKEFTQNQKIEAFELILNSSKESLINEKIEFDYYSSVKLSLQKGGLIERIIKNNECFTFQIENVPISMSLERLKEWINEYSDIISIKPIEKVKNQDDLQFQEIDQQTGISYIIQVEDQSDVNFFIEVFDETEMDNNKIKIKKISNNLKNQQEGFKIMEESIGARIKWYNLKCEGPALIEYDDSIKCDQVWEILQKEKNFTRKDPNTIQFKYYKGGINFNNEIDWIDYLKSKCNLKPLKITIDREKKADHLKQEGFIKYIISNNITPNFQLLNFNTYPQTSKRSAKIQFLLESNIQEVVKKYNYSYNVIGCTRTFVSPFYYYTHQIDSSIRNYIKHALEQDEQIDIAIQQNIFKVTFLTQENDLGQSIEVIKIKARNIGQFQVFKQKLISYIEGSQILISKDKYSINKLQSSEGKIFINDLSLHFNCYIIYRGQVTSDGDYIIHIYGLHKQQLQELQEKIEEMLGANSTLILPFNEQGFKLATKSLILEDIKQEFNLEQIYFNKAKRQLIVEGLQQNINTFREQFSEMISNFSKMQAQIDTNQQGNDQLANIQSPECEICFMDIDTAYRLQACRHKFCLPCVNLYLVDCLKNVEQFPLKCPKCSQEMIIQDLVRLLSEQQWQKLVNLSLNKYITENGTKLSFCFTPNCLYIFDPRLTKYRCPLCKVQFCIPCQKPNHPGLTCEEARLGVDILFKKYMEEVDARYCPNKSCGAILMKIDGCNKVECRNCHKAICWHKSCMIPFDSADKCYEHLRNRHGGYYDDH